MDAKTLWGIIVVIIGVVLFFVGLYEVYFAFTHFGSTEEKWMALFVLSIGVGAAIGGTKMLEKNKVS
ncbi:hypothetical protein [Desulfonatronum sp. SC1]|uniref:hypothetical protein n=1 Tax=Desulfonatronum sp. SC1 TaxID=2109626 RepID=UPI000D320E25|nr:hypothetical protein [Desulfonatronum sp. SC1]PTN36835.1 hypothetical protein C6366_08165 [Desulfonatronum sp. SC1]